MAAIQGQFTLPLLAFQHHVGQLYIDPQHIQFAKGLGQSDLCVVEQGRLQRANGKPINIVCKVWRPFVVATPQDFRELLLEASKLHRLQHPNITRFLGLGCFAHGSLAEVRESMFMVEEYVGERTLRKLISEQMRCRHKNLYDARSALRWAGQVASALSALHEQQPAYVHNDVKADNVFLTDAPLFGVEDAKLGDLKPHRHVYDREPCTLSRHHQQQRLASAANPSSLRQPRYTLERISACSSGCGEGEQQRRLSLSSATSSSAAAEPPLAVHVVAAGVSSGDAQQPKQPAFRHAVSWGGGSDAGSWSSGASNSAGTPTAVAAGTAAAAAVEALGASPAAAAVPADTRDEHGSVTRGCSLPVPIAARGSHTVRGSSCPSNWNPGLDGRSPAGVHDAAAPGAAVGAGSPGYFSASSQHSFSSVSLNSSSSAGVADASSCPSSAPPTACSLAAEVAAADAAADAAAAAAGDEACGEQRRGIWGPAAALRQHRDGTLQCLSDSASSTGGAGEGCSGKAGVRISLAADADAEDQPAPAVLSAAADGAKGTTAQGPCQKQQQQRGRRGLAKGALATALASARKPGQQQEGRGLGQLGTSCSSPPDVPPQAASSPQKPGLLSILSYRRSKSTPLEDDGVCHPHMQLAHSAPDIARADTADGDEAVQHGALLMPLQLSEPTGLCSLQNAGSGGSSSLDDACKAAVAATPSPAAGPLQPLRLHSSKGSSPAAAATAAAAGDGSSAAHHHVVQSVGKQLRHAHTMPASAGSAGSCVYYGWELLPSGAASPCGAVHSSMLDLFADVAGEDVITSRRYRDSCHYTLVPGSFVQQRSPLSITTSAPLPRSKSAGWDASAPAGTTISITSSGCSQVAASAGSKWTPASLLQLQQQQQQQGGEQQLEQGPSIGKGYAPTAIESKQHGSNSAFAALTAIDCIAEEGSSIATDSCAPSRESSAHGGPHFYAGSSEALSTRGSQELLQPQPRSPQQQGLSSQPLLTASSLTKALGLSLLRHRSSNSSLAGRSSSGGLCVDSPKACGSPTSPSSLHGSSAASLPGSGGSPSKQQLLHLLVTASGGSNGSLIDSEAMAAALGDDGGSPIGCKQGVLQDGGLQGSRSDAAEQEPQPELPAARPPVKKVRFSLARPTGTTASRDFGLLYAAPEVVRGERPTEKVDVFAFGCLLYELLSRRLLASSVAEVCARNASRRSGRHGSSGQHHREQQQRETEPATAAPDAAAFEGSDSGSPAGEAMPQHQLLLSYAQLVAGGYRPPMLPHFPEPVQRLIARCWAGEPHERPRMSEVLQELQAWQKNRQLLSALNGYVLALADMGYPGGSAKQPACGCVIS